MGSKKKIVSVDREAAKEAVVEAGRKAKKSVTQKVAAGSSRARQGARRAGRAAGKVSGKVAETRSALGREVQERRNGALHRALRTCIFLSKKQTAVLEKLEGSFSA